MGGLCWGFPKPPEKHLYNYPPDSVSSPQSLKSISSGILWQPIWRVCEHTCWFMRRIAMSFLSRVNLSNICSIVDVSVLASTTRKFFWASGGGVTSCPLTHDQYSYDMIPMLSSPAHRDICTPIPASNKPVTESCSAK